MWPLFGSFWPQTRGPAQEIRAELDRLAKTPLPPQFRLEQAARRRLNGYLDGLEAYRRHPFARNPRPRPLLWSAPPYELRDYAPESSAPPVLVIPSLINGSAILDLLPGRSFLEKLVQQGLRPLLMDWGEPTHEQLLGYDLDHYICGPLEAAAEAAAARCGPLLVVGYCMGGLLALALALRRPRLVRGLVALATPWDFHSENLVFAQIIGSLWPLIARRIAQEGSLSAAAIQQLFLLIDPLVSLRKFTRFAHLDQESAEARSFVAVEDWANQGVPLAARVAEVCLRGWYGENRPFRGLWRVAGAVVRPSQLSCPSLSIIPRRDRLVPPDSAQALAAALPGGACLSVRSGHIGTMIGRRAESEVWQPLCSWLHAHK